MARATNLDRKQKKRRPESQFRRMKKRVCYFCQERIEFVDWKDVALLRKYMSDRAKIRSRRVTGNCPRHQREVGTGYFDEVMPLPSLPAHHTAGKTKVPRQCNFSRSSLDKATCSKFNDHLVVFAQYELA